MKYGGAFDLEIEKKKIRICLNLTALAEVEEDLKIPLQEILEGIANHPLRIIPRLLWHGHRVACWDLDSDPVFSERQFLAKIGSMDWQEITPKIIETLSSGENEEEKKRKPRAKK